MTDRTVGAPDGAPATPPAAELSLRVLAEDDSLVWEVTNAREEPVRLWEQSNSWGWPMPRLHVDAGGPEPHLVQPAQRLWTRNFPSSVELAPQESARYVLRGEDFDADGLEPLFGLRDRPLRVRAELRCEPSPEAVEHEVWCGRLLGRWQELAPPQDWLGEQQA